MTRERQVNAALLQLGVDQPDYGMLFADMGRDEDEPIDLGELVAPRIEAEIAFVMGRALARERPTIAEVIGAIDLNLAKYVWSNRPPDLVTGQIAISGHFPSTAVASSTQIPFTHLE